MVAYQYRIDTGYPGRVNRVHDATVVAEIIDTASPPPGYGIMLVMDPAAGQVRAPAAGDTASEFTGLYVSPYPTQGGGPVTGIVNDPLYQQTPPNSGVANVLKRGFMTVQLNAASPAVVKGQAVGIFIGAPTAGNPAGGVTGAAPGATVLAVPGSTFTGPADAKGITEVAYNL
jgi:hypothetical protein